jgi:hypothetical protein
MITFVKTVILNEHGAKKTFEINKCMDVQLLNGHVNRSYPHHIKVTDQINEDLIEEKKEEVELKYKCIVVRVDKEYRWVFFKYLISLPGRLDHNYRRTLNQTLYDYFKIETPKYLE